MWRIVVAGLLISAFAEAQVVIERKGGGRVVITNTTSNPNTPRETTTPSPGSIEDQHAKVESTQAERRVFEQGVKPSNADLHVALSAEPRQSMRDGRLTVERIATARSYGLFENGPELFATIITSGAEDRNVFRVLRDRDLLAIRSGYVPGLVRPRENPSLFEFARLEKPEGEDRLPQTLHLYLGSDASHWKRNVPVFGSLHYRDVFPGVDALVTSNEFWTETEFIFGAGTDISAFSLAYPGDVAAVLEDGSIVARVAGSDQSMSQPPIEFFQLRASMKVPVRGGIVLERNRMYHAIAVTNVDSAEPLHMRVRIMKWARATEVLTPEEELNQRKQSPEIFENGAAAADAKGFAYVAESLSCESSTSEYNSGKATAVTRYDPSGVVVWTAVVGSGASSASGDTGRYFVSVDRGGDAIVTGAAASAIAFPWMGVRATPHQQTSFLSRISADGNLKFSALLPIEDASSVEPAGIAETDHGLLCAAATVVSGRAIIKGGDAPKGGADGYIACFDPSSPEPLRFSTFVGGSGFDVLAGIAAAPGGALYIGGTTLSRDLPGSTGNGLVGERDAFVARIETHGPAVITAVRYLGAEDESIGPEQWDQLGDIAVGPDGTVWLAGQTAGSDFPIVGEPLAKAGGSLDVFVTGLSPKLDSLRRSFRFGSTADDEVTSLSTDSHGNLYVMGVTGAPDLPGLHPATALTQQLRYLFLTKINSAQTALLWSTALGTTELRCNMCVRDLSFAVGEGGRIRIPLNVGMVRDGWGSGRSWMAMSTETSLVEIRPASSSPKSPTIKSAAHDGTTLTIQGEGFAQGAVVRVDGVVVQASMTNGGHTLVVKSGLLPAAARLDVINPDQQSATTLITPATGPSARNPTTATGTIPRIAIFVGIVLLLAFIAVGISKKRMRR